VPSDPWQPSALVRRIGFPDDFKTNEIGDELHAANCRCTRTSMAKVLSFLEMNGAASPLIC